MTTLEPWALSLISVGALLVAMYVVSLILQKWAQKRYHYLKSHPPTACDIDAFVGPSYPPKHLKVCLVHQASTGGAAQMADNAGNRVIPLEVVKSPHVPGLWVSQKLGTTKDAKPVEEVLQAPGKKPIIIGTIRMGFGHHRLAYSAASWAVQNGYPCIFHDLLNIDSPESDLIKSTDEMYSKWSRRASELGGVVERLWGAMMKAGDADALRVAALTASLLQPLLKAYPKDSCIITSHQLVALTAAAAGFTNVVNLVVDNHPQWFLTVPKTVNLVQGPVNYQVFAKMGVSFKELEWAGHWCPYQMVSNIPTDCQRRLERVKASKPLRILIPVGGAGAQRKFIVAFVRALAPLVKDGKVQLFLNAGDHAHMKSAFLEVLDACSLRFDTVKDTKGVMDFQSKLLTASNEPSSNVTLFTFDEYFPAVATTDILCRVSDVLACKPSELAFYCVPKLHIRRVGDHEADSACRSSELGDGTVEAREVPDAMAFVDLFLKSPDMLVSMNEAIIRNGSMGLYDGCKKAVELVAK